MTFQIHYPHSYNKKAAKFLKKHPNLKEQYRKCLMLLELNPFHPSLRLHQLKGQLEGLHSISINLQYRITLELLIQDEEIYLINVGDHQEVY